ncbi:hypothetical protein B296_00051726 [Ensete ventricosum]|uniref:Uncharacterized protein n=1 Tax=Ensete ventricosum TaxID=4639 RepID=A0A426YFI9_ENSVE|nr:hypothetical protein B296_00051726 [Ensete ventricosum]
MSQDPAESLTEWDKIGVRSGLLRDSSVADPDHGSGADSEAVERSRQPFVVPGIRVPATAYIAVLCIGVRSTQTALVLGTF